MGDVDGSYLILDHSEGSFVGRNRCFINFYVIFIALSCTYPSVREIGRKLQRSRRDSLHLECYSRTVHVSLGNVNVADDTRNTTTLTSNDRE